MRRKLVPVVALSMACLLAVTTACSTGNRKKRNRSADRPAGTAAKRDDVDAAPATARATPTPRRTGDQLTCPGLRNTRIGSSRVRYRGYAAPIRLSAGRWSDRNGTTVELQRPCAVGDLDGDGAGDAIGVVMLDGGGTGRFFTLAAWRNVKGEPDYQAQVDLGDRTPVESVSVRGGRATVVYLTRPADSSMAELSIRRTAVYQLRGTTLAELSHTDARVAGASGDGDSADSGTAPDSPYSPTRTRRPRSR
ncbi:hypothetical protein C5N14_30650 [Micromonospora sp. MW-13]|uniref:hypothetical protein n=1 Tax=unclassified Micromonospora TaxID=2617518 RepID=UPI000EDAF67D|nr:MULTISPECIES: hypothetical protein [unclassified Micromonospora]MCX4471424.1 hypothetical protein [Micromonospora sp. NBC_01655]RGC65064.1 hypothetical protein C5N14_30650 [Micromonospora sp. MW-13]